ncbi:MAG: formylglycine-generating enzyme family protein [Thermoflexibacter sp.]|nr:formylglycine-generating enzyme family protein [Thermoflexibacter sp.]
MDSLRQELLDLVNEIEIATLFERFKKLRIVDPAASNLRAEFVHGNYKHDFYQRVKLFIDHKFDELEEKEKESFSKAESIEALQKHIEEYQIYQGQTIAKAKQKLENLLYQERLQSSWKNAQEADQIPIYQDFITEFPKEKELISIAQQRIAQLEEEVNWKDKTNKISEILDSYLQEYPKGIYLNSIKSITKIIKAPPPLLVIPLSSHVYLEMIYVEGGTFEMGYKEGRDGEYSEYMKRSQPLHFVTLDSFYIGKFTVTQEQYQVIMGKNPSRFKGEKLPVEQVSWEDTQDFIKKLNGKTGKKFRLPTEAEWEYAARGGNQSQGFMYAGSNNINEVAWYSGNSGNETYEVGLKKPNELGIYDMSGNLWEWCEDYWDEKFYEKIKALSSGEGLGDRRYGGAKNPVNKNKADYYVLRGGSWNNDSSYCRLAYRNRLSNGRSYIYGFRVCL